MLTLEMIDLRNILVTSIAIGYVFCYVCLLGTHFFHLVTYHFYVVTYFYQKIDITCPTKFIYA